MKTEKIKLFFAYLAYISYLISVFLKNEAHIEFNRYEYIFCLVIAVSLKLSHNVEIIEKFVVDNTELAIIKSRVDSILELQSNPASRRTEEIVMLDRGIINIDNCEPYTESEIDTHRSIDLNDKYKLQIRNKNIV